MLTTAPRGTKDILPQEIENWRYVEAVMRRICAQYGYKEIRTPVFEHTELFKRGIGDTTDVVEKEMYTFTDRGNRSITLRPENTASAVRAFCEHKLYAEPAPTKLYYIGPMFRYDRPQAGRYRQFHQFGIEALGVDTPAIDAEAILLAVTILKELGLKDLHLKINSVGCPKCRPQHRAKLQDYFRPHLEELCDDCKSRFERNPLRLLDCKVPHDHELAAGAPSLGDCLCEECREHFEGVKKLLTAAGIDFEVDNTLVRGLDYYTRTVFEFVSGDIGAQATVCGGGRYDGLIAQMGGPSVPSLGFAMGIERIMLLLEAQKTELPRPAPCDIYIAARGDNAALKAAEICARLRQDGFSAQTDICGRGLKAQMKYADKTGAEFTMVLGDNELETGKARLKNMASGSETEVRLENLADELLSAIHSSALDNLADSILKQ